ncbi:Enoyl-coa delta isomerase [Thalictrum thalictroides]|uniref:Enoyl-coa delta isomerase n=1 Tax=Thalictrum thalictroides TaxID=46969 RepID=A0A7J6V4X8_THATH|nr:Enoyl-coa delta isomerase [Thalictrum thalictroides]
MVNEFKLVVADFISLPLPTIACITGHAAAAGFMLAISHDYLIMRKGRGVLYMSEIDIGMTFPDYFMDLMREKLHSPKNIRNICLHAMKIKAEDGIKMGIIDEAYDSSEECMEAALKIGEKLGLRKWNGEVYGEIRKNSLKGLLPVLGLVNREVVVARL